MRRVLLFAVLLAVVSCGPSVVESPLNGTWRVVLADIGEEKTLFLVETIQKSTGPTARLVAAGQKELEDVKFEAERDEEGALRLTVSADGLRMLLVAQLPEGEAHPHTLLGYGEFARERQFVRFERTEDKKLDQKKSTKTTPGASDLKRAVSKDDFKERASALRPLVDDHANDILGYYASLELLGALAASGSPEANLRSVASKPIAFGSLHGSAMGAQASVTVARILLATGKTPGLAVEFAQKAHDTLGSSTEMEERASITRTLYRALTRAEKSDEARAVGERLEQLDEELDRRFLEKEITFPTEKVTRRAGRGDRTVLVELFTGAHCGPCVPADVAFDALSKSRQGGDIVLLQYHTHTAGIDALGNSDVESRAEYYRLAGTPWFYLDGAEGPEAGGPPDQAREVYGGLLRALQEPLSATAGARLDVTAKRTGERIDVQAKVSDLKKPGERVKLRLVLVEDLVRYPGRNGQRLHHAVVRAFPGGVDGKRLTEASTSVNLTVDLAELRKTLGQYLDGKKVSPENRPLAMKKLKLVAFVQDDRTREVVQSAEVEVTE